MACGRSLAAKQRIFRQGLARRRSSIVQEPSRSDKFTKLSLFGAIHVSKRIFIRLTSIAHFLSPVPSTKQTSTRQSDNRNMYVHVTASPAKKLNKHLATVAASDATARLLGSFVRLVVRTRAIFWDALHGLGPTVGRIGPRGSCQGSGYD
jgi:hypothetical protein